MKTIKRAINTHKLKMALGWSRKDLEHALTPRPLKVYTGNLIANQKYLPALIGWNAKKIIRNKTSSFHHEIIVDLDNKNDVRLLRSILYIILNENVEEATQEDLEAIKSIESEIKKLKEKISEIKCCKIGSRRIVNEHAQIVENFLVALDD